MNRSKYIQEKKQSSRKKLAIKIALFVTLSTVLVVGVYAVALKKKAVDAADRAYEALDDRIKS
ncbi:hypothetical protein J4G37_58780, partial [Microvirga sp. 3-52]|nr:hypothetical protein [Microvirga sp. 3-52]